TPAWAAQTDAPTAPQSDVMVETVAEGLIHPWAIAFLPDGRMLVTERPGRMRLVNMEGQVTAPLEGVPKVFAQGQGGLLDVALAPDFQSSGTIYFSYAEPREGGRNGTTVARARLVEGDDRPRLEDVQIIFRQQPSYRADVHFGSRIVV